MSGDLRFVDACTHEHFAAMSRIHALGWRDTYVDAVPAHWMAEHVTDDHWTDTFRANYEGGIYHGLLLYRGDTPVGCINYGPARTEERSPGSGIIYDNRDYEDWGELTSFYAHPDERDKGYGGLLIEEAARRLSELGHGNAFVFVLRENEKARRFYAAHGFQWDGTCADIPFPPDAICVDLRYVRKL